MKLFIIFVVLLFSGKYECERILAIFPTASISHQIVFRTYVKALLDRGHSITVITTDPFETLNTNLTQIDIHYSYEVFMKNFNFVEVKKKNLDEVGIMKASIPLLDVFFRAQIEHPEILNLIKNAKDFKFDAVVVEYLFYHSWLAFAELFKAPLIGISSFDTTMDLHETVGNLANPILHPEILFPFAENLTFRQRYNSLRYYVYNKFYFIPIFNRIFNKQIREYFPTVEKSVEELKKSVQVLLVNTSPALGFIRPLVPKTVQLGFLHIEPPKPLKDIDLIKFLDNSKNGVIYMSLGSNVRSSDLDRKIVEAFTNTFKSLDYEVLWKWETDNVPEKSENLRFFKWLPQSDLLAHPKIKLFITQGGQQSMEESIDRCVPMIVFPFLGDQYTNAHRLQKRNIGIQMDIATINEHKLKAAIVEMLKPIHKNNMIKLREIIYDQPMASKEKSVWWTEYIMRHNGAKHLHYHGNSVPFYQKFFLDFIVIGFIAIVIMYLIIAEIIKFIYKLKANKLKNE